MRIRKGPSPGRNQRPAQALPASAVSSKTPPQQAPNPQTPHLQTPFEREQTTKRRGEISELAFALAAARHGFGISRPYGDSERYDIILDPLQERSPETRLHRRQRPPPPGPRASQILYSTAVRPLPRQRPPPH